MRADWFEHGHILLQPLVVDGLRQAGRPIDYLETTVARKVQAMTRADLENIALCAVMFGMSGTSDAITLKKQ
jgi:hypothetical protein